MRDHDFLVGVRHPALVPRRDFRERGILGQRLVDVFACGVGEHQALQQGVAGHPVGAVQPGVGHLADGVEPREVGAAAQVGHDAAAGVVRGRHDRDGLAGQVDVVLEAVFVGVRERLAQVVGRLVADVEVHVVQPEALHFVVDGARDDVPGRQFAAFVEAAHELPAAAGQAQLCAFAAQRFGHQEGLGARVAQAGRVELDEFHVGHAAAGPPRHGQPVAGRGVRVGGVQVDLARPAGGQDDAARAVGVDRVGAGVLGVDADAAGFPGMALDDQVDRDAVAVQFHVGAVLHLFHEGFLDGAAGVVGDMRDPPPAVAAFLGQVQPAGRRVGGEVHALALQPLDHGGAAVRDLLHDFRAAQPASGRDRVGDMQRDRVLVVQHGRHAALGVGGRAFGGARLAQQRDPQARVRLQGGAQARRAAAEDQDIRVVGNGRTVCNHDSAISVMPNPDYNVPTLD